jgi:hypothetical protein
MDGKTFLLGFIPPLLAFLAEARNPVSAEAIQPKAEEHAVQHVFPASGVRPGFEVRQGHTYDEQATKNALVITMVALGETAAEVSGIVPTWLSITSATTAVFADIVPDWVFLLILLLVTGGSALWAIRYFQRVDYQSEAVVESGSGSWPCKRDRKVDCISCWIKTGNLGVAVIVLVVWLSTSDTVPEIWSYITPLFRKIVQ